MAVLGTQMQRTPLTMSARGSILDVRIWRLESVPALEELIYL